MYAFFYICSNQLLDDYCPFSHSMEVRAAYLKQIEDINNGLTPDVKIIRKITEENTQNDEDRRNNWQMLVKFPE